MKASAASNDNAPLKIVHVAMEMTPVVKLGGLADVVEGLSRESVHRGHEVTIILPGYEPLLEGPWDWDIPPHRTLDLGGRAHHQRFSRLIVPGHPARTLVLEDPRFGGRQGIYNDPATGEEYADAADRYAVFARGALEILQRMDLAPDILHLHDYHTALVPSLIHRAGLGTRFFAGTRTVFTIHNSGYQGLYPPDFLDRFGLGREAFYPGGPLEYFGKVNFLKAGILDADAVTTVSPRYAWEMQASPEFGHGLEGVLASRPGGVTGILNGIDQDAWNPSTDPHIPARYDADTLIEGRRENKAALLARGGLGTDLNRPVVGMIGRLVEQKGIDLLRDAQDQLVKGNMALVVLGSGQSTYERFLEELASRHPRNVFYCKEFDNPLAHLIVAGADIFLMPSRYEPCGLTQMISMRYGAVPVVRGVGGLADTVIPANGASAGTGFVFDPYTAEAMMGTLHEAFAAYEDPDRWRTIQMEGMARDFSWGPPAAAYDDLYRRLLGA